MTQIKRYCGRESPITINHEVDLKSRDFRTMYKCDNVDCENNTKAIPAKKVISFRSDLHACKQSKLCRDKVYELWEHERKTFNEDEYYEERYNAHKETGFDEEAAKQYAKVDVDNKLKELKLTKKKKYILPKEHVQKLTLRAWLANQLQRQTGMGKSESMKLAHKVAFTPSVVLTKQLALKSAEEYIRHGWKAETSDDEETTPTE